MRHQPDVLGTSVRAVSVGLLLLAIAATPAQAKAKIVSNGCTAAQIQSAKAAECIKEMEQDVIHSRPYHHALYCSSSGALLCCVVREGAIQPASCTVLTGRPKPNQSEFDPNLLNGGSVVGGSKDDSQTDRTGGPVFDPSLTIR